MLPNSEKNAREMRWGEASLVGLVEPTKAVVTEAMRRIRWSLADSEDDRKEVCLKNRVTGRLYRITLIDANSKKNSDLSSGLFVNGIQLDSGGQAVNMLEGIQLPRDPKQVNQSSLFLLRSRSISPSDMQRLATELESQNTKRINSQAYLEAEQKFSDDD